LSEDTTAKPATTHPAEEPTYGAQILREIVGVIVGLAVAFGIVGAVLTLTFSCLPIPHGLDFLDPVALSNWFASMPIAGVVVVTLIFPGASFHGAVVMSFISRRRIWPRMVLGVVMAGTGYAAISMLPSDTGFAGAAMLVCIPISWIGMRWYFTGIWKDWNWRW